MPNLNKKGLERAIEAGKVASNSLSEMIKKLDSARSWGIWDILGGKLIANIGKHSAINKANEISQEARINLREFQNEINNITEFEDLEINISGFATFADFFFDGIFVDFFVQSKIKEAIENAREIQAKVEEIIREMERSLYDINKQIKGIED